jgi:putative endonuclease
MQHHQAMVFIEVRYRASRLYGNASETIDLRKRDRIMKAAQHFLITHPRLASLPCRFDVVSVHGTFQDPELGWIQGAFEA